MRVERRWAIAAVLALSVGALGSETYARLASPYYKAVAEFLAASHPWTVTGVDVARDGNRPGMFLRLHGQVRVAAGDAKPAATLITRIQAGAVVEGPIIFWTLLLVWPASTIGVRITRLLVGLPIFLGLEAATTVCQLLNGLAGASAMLAGNPDPVTAWEHWSRFVESGGRDVLAVCAALLTVAGVSAFARICAAR